jgi:hypothetical protein
MSYLPTPAAPDHLLDVMLMLGALAAVAGVLGGLYLAARYGRRASVSIEAKAYDKGTGILIVARPRVKSVGIFRVKFHKVRGAAVKATETWIDEEGKVRVEGVTRPHFKAFGRDDLVEGSEELVTTVLILMPRPKAAVIGWMVDLEIRGRHRFTYYIFKAIPKVPDRGYFWTDRVFVDRPTTAAEVVK